LLNATMNCRTPIFLSHQENAFHHVTSLELGWRSGEDDFSSTSRVVDHAEGVDDSESADGVQETRLYKSIPTTKK
jgi:hypothetical protein